MKRQEILIKSRIKKKTECTVFFETVTIMAEITAIIESWGSDKEYIIEQLGWLLQELMRENLENIEVKIKGYDENDNRQFREGDLS